MRDAINSYQHAARDDLIALVVEPCSSFWRCDESICTVQVDLALHTFMGFAMRIGSQV